jgi:hypothetical protein
MSEDINRLQGLIGGEAAQDMWGGVRDDILDNDDAPQRYFFADFAGVLDFSKTGRFR